MRTQRLFLAALALPLVGIGFSGCSSSGNVTRGEADSELAASRSSEFGTLSKEQVENFNRKLAQLAEATSADKRDDIQGLQSSLASDAAAYESALKKHLNESGDPGRQATAAFMVGYLGKAEYALPLARLMTDSSVHKAVRNRASIGLAAMGETINRSSDRAAVMTLLQKSMLPSGTDGTVRQHAVAAYVAAYTPGTDSLTPVTDIVAHDPSNDVRVAALSELRQLGTKAADAIPDIVVALKDPNDNVKVAAAQALGTMPDPRALVALHGAMGGDSARVRKEAVYAMAGQHTVDPVIVRNEIEVGLNDFDDNVVASATMAARRIGDRELVRSLIPLLNSGNTTVRLETIGALGDMVKAEDAKAAFSLVWSLDDTDVTVRSAAHSALKRINGKQDIQADAEAWRGYYYKAFPKDLDPEVIYAGQARPRPEFDQVRNNGGGGGSSQYRNSASRTTPRTTNRTTNRNNNRNTNTNTGGNWGGGNNWGGNNGGNNTRRG